MPEKPKIAFYWCASCGGCEETVVDLEETLLDLAAKADIVFWPVALDFKRHHVEALPEKSILATFLNGAIRTSEQREMAHLLRSKSQLLVAFGSCSQLGGIPGLANLFGRDDILRTAYFDSPSTVNPDSVLPSTRFKDDGHEVELPLFDNLVKTLDQVVDVDYYVPGCPPPTKVVRDALSMLLAEQLPAKGAVLAPDIALCEECPRKDSKPEQLFISAFKRPQEILIDEQQCLLAQGLICLGPATRSGCEAACLKGNMPCTGCGASTSRVRDQGAKELSAIASLIESKDEAEIGRVLASIPDLIGTFYRYGLPGSLLRRKRINGHAQQEVLSVK